MAEKCGGDRDGVEEGFAEHGSAGRSESQQVDGVPAEWSTVESGGETEMDEQGVLGAGVEMQESLKIPTDRQTRGFTF